MQFSFLEHLLPGHLNAGYSLHSSVEQLDLCESLVFSCLVLSHNYKNMLHLLNQLQKWRHQEHDHGNYDQLAPDFDMTCRTIQCVSLPNLKSFGPSNRVMGQRSWRHFCYVIWQNRLVGMFSLTQKFAILSPKLLKIRSNRCPALGSEELFLVVLAYLNGIVLCSPLIWSLHYPCQLIIYVRLLPATNASFA